jgi:hypothetical protein
VREGVVPLNIVAHFYVSPALRCWYNLQPFIGLERKRRTPPQPGHLWEWENFVFGVLIKNVRAGKGIWRGVSKHDNLEQLCNAIEEQEKTNRIPSDRPDYSPGSTPWVIRPWYRFYRGNSPW